MKTKEQGLNKLAMQTYLTLITGLTIIAVLLTVILTQHEHLFRSRSIPVQLKLNYIPEKKLSSLNTASTNTIQPTPSNIMQLGKPWAIIRLKPSPLMLFVYALYWLSVIILILLSYLLCYWAIRRVNQPYAFIRSALTQLSQNINSQIVLPSNHSDLHVLANQISIIQNQLRKNLHSRTQVLAAISHDLRTPITRLKLRAELLNDDRAKEKMLKDLEEVELMLNSVLAFSKDFIQEELPTQFNFSDLIQAICDDMDNQSRIITAEIAPDIIYQGRMLALKRAIQNIVDNAVKYGEHNVHVSLTKQQNKIIFVVADDGPGVPDNMLKAIFEPFVRVDSGRNSHIKGSGLGLSISKEIIDSHNGSIQAQNLLSKGLKITVIL